MDSQEFFENVQSGFQSKQQQALVRHQSLKSNTMCLRVLDLLNVQISLTINPHCWSVSEKYQAPETETVKWNSDHLKFDNPPQ